MKKLVATSVVVTAFGIVAACSQGDTHPPFLGDCDACNHQPISTGGDAATDTSKPDAGAKDSSTSDSSTSDATAEASVDAGNDGALLDTGTGD